MQNRYRIHLDLKTLALLVLTAGIVLAGPQVHGEPKPITAEPITERHRFDGKVELQLTQRLDGLREQTVNHPDASHITVVRFIIQPGAVFPWHTHPGTVLISITEGDFVFMFAEDCVPREYGPGDALVDPGDRVHTAYNPQGEEETVVVATLLGVPAEGPLTIPVDEDRGIELDRECELDRAAIAAGDAP